MSRLRRSRENRMIAGVCAGLAGHFDVSAGKVRLLFMLSCLLPGPQVLLYVALWIVMPTRERHTVYG